MDFTFSRVMSTATAAYAVFALVSPRHLGRAVTSDGFGQREYDPLARVYGGRDLAISALGIFGPTKNLVTAAMGLRIANDLADGTVLSLQAADGSARAKILGATMTWAALNTVALVVDLSRS